MSPPNLDTARAQLTSSSHRETSRLRAHRIAIGSCDWKRCLPMVDDLSPVASLLMHVRSVVGPFTREVSVMLSHLDVLPGRR